DAFSIRLAGLSFSRPPLPWGCADAITRPRILNGSYPPTPRARVGPPEAPTTLGAPTKTVAPADRHFDRLATHSRPHLPAPSQSLWTAKSFDAPKSSDSVSTANPATSRSFSRNSHASFEKPGKCSV